MNLIRFYNRNKLTIATWTYWILLLYILAALIWWFIELLQQNQSMYLFKKAMISLNDPNYSSKLLFIEDERQRNIAQYLGEGFTFMALTLIGAVFVYRAVRRQILLSQQQQNFMMAITHELKTPISIIQLGLETLQRRKLEHTQHEKLLQVTLQENERLNELCENILLATRMDIEMPGKTLEEINLTNLLEESLKKVCKRFPNRSISANIENDVQVKGDPLLLHLQFNNLIDNAIKYSPAEKPVVVKLNMQDAHPTLEIHDEGPGIPQAEKVRIFEKFYRMGNESTRRTKGTGLGLYLSKKIAEYHGAHLSVRDNLPNGSIFTVQFD